MLADYLSCFLWFSFCVFCCGRQPLASSSMRTPSKGVTCRSRGRISEHWRDPSITRSDRFRIPEPMGLDRTRTRTNTNQMTQKQMLRAEGECACVAQITCAEIRGRGQPSASQRERHLWVVSTLKMHTHRKAPDLQNTKFHCGRGQERPFDAQGALCSAPGQNAPTGQELLSQPSE